MASKGHWVLQDALRDACEGAGEIPRVVFMQHRPSHHPQSSAKHGPSVHKPTPSFLVRDKTLLNCPYRDRGSTSSAAQKFPAGVRCLSVGPEPFSRRASS